jgi:FtsP/CotA-like multicopper oxidase with cupredoxin domain
MNNRRSFLKNVFGLGAGLAVAPTVLNAQRKVDTRERSRTGQPVVVETPDIPNLPFTMENGVKVFNLIAEPVKREIVPGRVIDAWGYNGTTPGPTIQVNNGDRVRIVLENRLPEPTSMHWHGFEIPIAMDGMPYISQKPIPPGGKYVYEFSLHQEGTFFYHSHGAMQEMMGMLGMFVMHPKQAHAPRVDHDFGLVLQEWALLPNNSVPNTANMEFNWLTINGRSGPSATPLLVRLGSRVRIRFVNIGMDHHPMHLHGHTFWTTGTEGGRQPQSTWTSGNTVLVGVAQARDIEFVADNPGDWMLHCHLPHHMMNNMSDLVSERMMTTSALSSEQAKKQMEMMAQQGGHGMHGSMEHLPAVAANANSVRGFPQDAFMEMPMDAAVVKPENHGLAKNWTAGMMGMMTLVRVLPDDRYDEIVAKKKSAPQQEQHHGHGG